MRRFRSAADIRRSSTSARRARTCTEVGTSPRFPVGRHIGEFERHLEAHLGGRLRSVCCPQQNRNTRAKSFKIALVKMYLRKNRIIYLRADRTLESPAGSARVLRRRETIWFSRSLSSSGERFVSIVPADATEMEPVSSETSTTTASLSS